MVVALLVQIVMLVLMAAFLVALGKLGLKTFSFILPESGVGRVAVLAIVVGGLMWLL